MCVVDEKQAGVEGGVCVGLMKEDVYVCIRFVISRLELKGRFFGMGIYV